jgi:tetratricopeptide (TPR) repeat protein
MAVLEKALSDEFERLHAEGQELVRQGRLKDAAEFFATSLAEAEAAGNHRLADRAFCNLCSVDIALSSGAPLSGSAANRLREILLRNDDPVNCRLAAYVLSRAYELRKEVRKGLFYARVAFDRSEQLGRADWIGSSRNQIGNLLVVRSLFREAMEEYRGALDSHPEEAAERRALIEANLAYCHLVQGNLDPAFTLLYRALRLLRRRGSVRGQMVVHVDLCYAHQEAGRLASALRHGLRGLRLAEEVAEPDSVKNALYLLGQTYRLLGEEEEARRCFRRLQDEFYPGSTGIPEFLMAIDVRKMINLRA